MAINDLIGKLVRGSVMAVGLYAAGCGGSDDRTGCQNDNDCRSPRVCVSGSCENPNGNEDGGQPIRDSGRPIEDRTIEDRRPPAPECNLENGDFNEQFEGSSLGNCWRQTGGAARSEVSGGELIVPYNTTVERNTSLESCEGSNFALEYRAKVNNPLCRHPNGQYVINMSSPVSAGEIYVFKILGFTDDIPFTTSPSFLSFWCSAPGGVHSREQDVDISQWHTVRVERRPVGYELFVNSRSAGLRTCSDNPSLPLTLTINPNCEEAGTDWGVRIDYITVTNCN